MVITYYRLFAGFHLTFSDPGVKESNIHVINSNQEYWGLWVSQIWLGLVLALLLALPQKQPGSYRGCENDDDDDTGIRLRINPPPAHNALLFYERWQGSLYVPHCIHTL